ncbi:MAG: serine/threonine-protein kinase, partial [Planctomycetota bacterium]
MTLIECPYCGAELRIKAGKSGSFKSICRKCGEPIRLIVDTSKPSKTSAFKLNNQPGKQSPSAKDDDDSEQPTRISTGAGQGDSRGKEPMVSLGSIHTNATVVMDESDANSVTPDAKTVGDESVSNPASNESGGTPARIGGYRILNLLGQGAMGAVYEAKQISLDRVVALKTVRSRIASSPAAMARFTREAYAAGQLVHHNVVQIYDFGEDKGKHFFSMEWVRGGPLDKYVKSKGRLDPRVAAGYILQAARGIAIAHQHGMVHRDIKPANLLLSEEGVVKVADLGLVKIPDMPDAESEFAEGYFHSSTSGTDMTMQGTAVGTPAYMAPEQNSDATSVDHRADIYSLGCTLCYLLTGRPPFGGKEISDVLAQHARSPIPDLRLVNPKVTDDLQAIINRSMAKSPDDRYASTDEMANDLSVYLGIESGSQYSPSQDDADRLESLVEEFEAASPLKLLRFLPWALVSLTVLLFTLAPVAGWQ